MPNINCFDVEISKNHRDIGNFLKATQGEFTDFFGIQAPMPSCFLIDSRKQFDEIWGKKTEDWQVAWVSDNNIFILKPEKFLEESSHNNQDNFWKILKHEYSHIYYRKLSGGINKPKWLNEGLAKYLAGQKAEEISLEDALDVTELHDDPGANKMIFPVGLFWVRFLLKNFGKDRMLHLIMGLKGNPSKKHFCDEFRKIYDFEFNKKELWNKAKGLTN